MKTIITLLLLWSSFAGYAQNSLPVIKATSFNNIKIKAVLNKRDTLLDFQNNMVYLKPNSLYNLPYTDAK